MLTTIFGFIIVLGVLITFHEFGHFWVARRCGVQVLRFSIGFGWPLWRRRGRDGVEYIVAAIPLGGYVQMLDSRRLENNQKIPPAQVAMAFDKKSYAARAAIISAGPLANFLLAGLIYWLLFIVGVEGVAPRIGEVRPESPAALAGIEPNSEIVAVDGRRVSVWRQVGMAFVSRLGSSDAIEISLRPWSDDAQNPTLGLEEQQQVDTSAERVVRIVLEKPLAVDNLSDIFAELGFLPWQPEREELLIATVRPGSAASRAGIFSGDKLLSINGHMFTRWSEWVDYISANPQQTTEILLRREGDEMLVSALLDEVERNGFSRGFLGVSLEPMNLPESMMRVHRDGPLAAIFSAGEQVWNQLKLMIQMFIKMAAGTVSADNLGGPIMIAQAAGDSLERGLRPFLSFMAFLSISLAVLNLLPIPVLDGGQLVMLLFERVKGSPLSPFAEAAFAASGILVVVSLMALAFYNDIYRLISG